MGKDLAHDPLYQECIKEALKSPCQKKGVGVVLVNSQGHIIDREHNRPIEGLEGLCKPTCIRFSIPSRTESMLSACGHAEERLIWRLIKKGYGPFLENLSLYVAGVTSDKVPEQRRFPEFTCLRCAVAMHYAEIQTLSVAHQGTAWVKQTAAQALASALQYARGEKKI